MRRPVVDRGMAYLSAEQLLHYLLLFIWVACCCLVFTIAAAPDCSSKSWAIFTIAAPNC